MIHVAVCGFYGKDNFGDDLFQREFYKYLQVDEVKITFFSDCKTDKVENYKSKYFTENDLYIIGGGDIINPNFWFFNLNIQKPIILLNVGVISNLLENKTFVNKLKSLNIIKAFVRDNKSLELLKKINIPCEFLPDIALTLEPCSFKINKKCVVNLNSYVFNGLFNNNVNDFLLCHKNIIHISEFLGWLIFFDWHVNIIPLQTNKYLDDRIINSMLYGHIKHKSTCEIIYDHLSEQEIIDEFSSADFILSTKYHSTVLAHTFNKNFIDITHHDKNLNFIHDNHLENNSISFYDLTKEKLINKIIELESNEKNTNEKEFLNYSNMWEEFYNFYRCDVIKYLKK